MFNPHMEAAKRFASAFLGQWTQIGAGTGQLFDTRLCDPFTALAVSHTQGPGGGPFKQGVVGPQVQRRVVKEQTYGDAAQLGVGGGAGYWFAGWALLQACTLVHRRSAVAHCSL